MKKYKLFLAIIASITLQACNDGFLDRYQEAINDGTFWNTPNDLKTYANRFYSYFPSGLVSLGDGSSDNQVPHSRPDFFWNEYPIPNTASTWNKSAWSHIRYTNYFLARYTKATGTETEINQYVGEVRFFRALDYANKINTFGDVPWLEEDLSTNDDDILYGPRMKRELVMDKIIEDLDYAIKWLPERPETGRIGKDVARHIKARLCLREGTYYKYHTELGISADKVKTLLELAASAAAEVMATEKYAIYTTGDPLNDYYNMFLIEDKSGLSEAILPSTYKKDIRQHNSTRSISEAKSGFSKDYVNAYLCTDGKPIGISELYKGDKNIADETTNRDPRLKQTILTPDFAWRIADNGTVTRLGEDNLISNYCYTGYNIIKYYSNIEANHQANSNTYDGIVYRYAETLLIYAEAKAELGTITQSDLDKSINLLRNRVGMPHLKTEVGFVDPNWPEWGYDLSTLLQEIRRERRVELGGEGFRWEDILRWKAGKITDNPSTYIGKWIPEEGKYAEVYGADRIRKWNDKLYLYPIPTNEILLNPQLAPQNSGWE
ncbi:RagB/SusD family nutrient uptake outer membrane protein [Bacteroides sp. 519]|uniref:RagB/SusD family nutrient uptake outer membrane protein n=1 Tax=Bacteroides sp. 519 TaxID=2302937 RepID=UPI0013D69A55|nr:RagB/SusD family nutrient uptake outer membrane protein [Bacteroides sp. 519]NDV60359.1 RagB/SusD family nutrient uptake outer membrane protein [Bacteroides sp. 519]